ncbi:MAG TPA: (Fe-S)-binding protein [Arenibaculum sp.]|nr:(Fe-S)-binding protein [Arenibaculum sp.]
MIASVLSLSVVAILAAGLLLAVLQARRWRVGRPAGVDLAGGLRALPGRYLVDVHDVVGRNPFNARFHALAAGGFLVSLALIVALAVPALRHPFVWGLLALALSGMLAGALMVGYRRRVERPPELSKGRFSRLPFALLAFAASFLIVALDQAAGGVLPVPVALALLVPGIWGCIELVLGVWKGPLKHAVHGALHLAAHPRPARFHDGAGRDTGLLPLDLGAEPLGVERPVDFPWNRLLGFDACVQCGRCETVCPAYAAGQPLNPKKLIQDLAAALDEEAGDLAYAGNHHPGRVPGQAHGGVRLPVIGEDAMIHPDTLWACTTCRACVQECPMMIEHVDAVVDLRRFQTLELGAVPGKAADMLEELRATDNPGGRDLGRRLDWATDLDLPVLRGTGACDVLLWVGDGAFDLRTQRTLRALVMLMRRAGTDVAVLGDEELDCGDVARRLGDENTFQDLARRNVETLGRYRFERIVTADPHALHTLRNEYPAFGGNWTVLHHSALLLELLRTGRLTVSTPVGRTVTYHDPCYLGRYNGETEAPRALLDAIGVERVEMARSGMRSSCCGGGGGAPLTDVAGKIRIPDIRMDHARETGAELVAVACPGCTLMLEGVVGPRPQVAEIAELVLIATEPAS